MSKIWKVTVASLDYRDRDDDGNCIFIGETGELEFAFEGTRGQARQQAVDTINDLYRLHLEFTHPMRIQATDYQFKDDKPNLRPDWWLTCEICGHLSTSTACTHTLEDWEAECIRRMELEAVNS